MRLNNIRLALIIITPRYGWLTFEIGSQFSPGKCVATFLTSPRIIFGLLVLTFFWLRNRAEFSVFSPWTKQTYDIIICLAPTSGVWDILYYFWYSLTFLLADNRDSIFHTYINKTVIRSTKIRFTYTWINITFSMNFSWNVFDLIVYFITNFTYNLFFFPPLLLKVLVGKSTRPTYLNPLRLLT